MSTAADSVAVPSAPPASARAPRRGEELPVFCERCGYILHGMPMVRCEQCDVLQFHCPECGHHQAINTLRPAFQRMLGRARATWLGLVVLFKLNYFGWLGFAWLAGGYEWSYGYRYQQVDGNWQGVYGPYELHVDEAIGMTILGALFGMVGRMLLLRWRSGWLVGGVLGTLVIATMMGGAMLRYWDRNMNQLPIGAGFIQLTVVIGLGVAIGAGVVWWIWIALAHLFLPKRVAGALLDWQRAMSTPRVSALARE